MNVIIANQYKDALSNLNIDIIKRMDGEFDVDTIVETFQNFYFNRMILDVTALRDYTNIATIQRLCTTLDASKIILFLPDDPRINNSFLSRVISLGIYNFTRDLSGIMYLMNNPNSYRDVAQYHDLAANNARMQNSMPQTNQMPEPVMQPVNNMNNAPQNMYNNNVPYQNPPMNNQYGNMPYNQMPMGMTGNPSPFNQNMNNNMQMPMNNGYYPDNNMNNYQMPNQGMQMPNPFGNQSNMEVDSGVRIIGFKDLTDDAGATTLIYMLKKQITNLKVLAVEFNSNDFSFFNDSELLSTSGNSTDSLRSKFRQFDLILLDLNKYGGNIETVCTDLIYLLEPSTIKLNSLMRRDRGVFNRINKHKLVLNKSLLSVSDVKEFEYEAKINVFYNIPPLDERKEHQMVLDSFMSKLGLRSNNSDNENKSTNNIFNIFKKN